MTENHKMTEQEFNELFSEDTSVKRQKELVKKATDRFSYIIIKLYKILNRDVSWFDFNNGYGETNGYFDPFKYAKEIDYEGSFGNQPKNTYPFTNYDDFIPTVWLKEDFEATVKKEYEDYQIEAAAKEKEQKEAKNKKVTEANSKAKLMEESIRSKLTPEEMCFINMENPINAINRLNKMLKDEEIKKYKSQKQNKK